jgi:hypothetical protein
LSPPRHYAEKARRCAEKPKCDTCGADTVFKREVPPIEGIRGVRMFLCEKRSRALWQDIEQAAAQSNA